MKRKTTEVFAPSPGVLKKASAVVKHYSFVIEPESSSGFIGTSLELPGVVAGGSTADECLANLRFALETVIASYLQDGKVPPSAHRREKRDIQVNVRFTQVERLILERESARQGFRGVGDLIRAHILRGILN